jgi:L-ascorbate metabolism protein UlaG (beta-lactamase superfamily)
LNLPKSDHCDGNVFFNLERTPNHGGADVIKWMMTRQRKRWPQYIHSEPGAKPPRSVDDSVRVTFVNHATVLIQCDGVNILTDPVWSKRCSPVRFAGPKRVRDAGIRYADLPPVHMVLISHNHYDHLDADTVRKLVRDHDPYFLTGIGNESVMKRLKINKVSYQDWWSAVKIPSLPTITFVPAQHFSGRSLSDRNKSLWGGFVVEAKGGCIFFAGDTGYGSHFKEIARRVGPIRLALLPIGAYEPRWFMSPVHMNPSDAVQAHIDLKAKDSMGIHFGTFQLTDEGIDEPKNDLLKTLSDMKISVETFWVPEFGESRIY